MDVLLLDEAAARGLQERLRNAPWQVTYWNSGSRFAVPTPPSPPAPCNRKPTANWACRPARPCRRLSGCMKKATSPTCVRFGASVE